MKINIQQVKNDIGAGQNFRFSVSAADILKDIEHSWISDPIVVTGEVVNDGRLLKVTGSIELVANFECDRCLEEYTTVLKISFLEEFQDSSDESSKDAEEISTYQGDEIDISELMRENVILAKPLKTVCSEDCCGLCPKCGTNLNISTCTCEKGVIDPRLAALQQLLDRK